MDDEVDLAIAWVLQRARELSPECDNAEEFLTAFAAPSGCLRCGRRGVTVATLAHRELVCQDCLTPTKS